MEEVIQALNALYHGDPVAQRNSDAWCRHWQQTPAAWQVSDQLISLGKASPEVQFFAAQTLRTKIQYDFFELPPTAHASLCESIIRHIHRFKVGNNRVLTQLCLACADLSIHLASTWKDPVDTFVAQFGQSADTLPALLELIKMLSEENDNKRVMCDPEQRSIHRQNLQGASAKVMKLLGDIRGHFTADTAKEKVLSCWQSWIPFSLSTPAEVTSSPLLIDCVQSIGHDALGYVAADALVAVVQFLEQRYEDAVYYENYEPQTDQKPEEIIEMLRNLLVVSLPHLQTKLSSARESGDSESATHVARVLTCIGGALLSDCVLKVHMAEGPYALLLQMIFMCTLPLNEDEPPISAASFSTTSFWSRLAEEYTKRRPLVRGDAKAVADQLPNAPWVPVMDELLKKVFFACMKLCEFPKTTGGSPAALEEEFWEFRKQVETLIEDFTRALFLDEILAMTMTALAVETRKPSASQHTMEAMLFALSHILKHIRRVDDSSILWQLINNLPSLLDRSPPKDWISTCSRLAAVDFLGSCAPLMYDRRQVLHPVLDMISSQLFSTAVSPEALKAAAVTSQSSKSSQSKSGRANESEADAFQGAWGSSTGSTSSTATPSPDKDKKANGKAQTDVPNVDALRSKSARAFNNLCVECGGSAALQEVADALCNVCRMTSTIMPEPEYLRIVDGVAYVVSRIEDDALFFKLLGHLLEPMLQSLESSAAAADSADKARETWIQLDRIGTVLSQAKPRGDEQSRAAREANTGHFIVAELWPRVTRVMQAPLMAANEKVVERASRCLKHAMRCAPNHFKQTLAGQEGLMNIVLVGFKAHRLSPYLYVAEWLATGYAEDPEVKAHLKELFNRLSELALASIQEKLSELRSHPELVEDCYGMFARYLRYNPEIPLESPSLTLALQLSLNCLTLEQPDAASSVYGTLESMYFYAKKPEPGSDEDRARPSHLAPEYMPNKLRPILTQFGGPLLATIFRYFLTAPPKFMLQIIKSVMPYIVRAFPEETATWLDGAFAVLPASVMPESMKRASKQQIDRCGRSLERCLDDIAYRCEQLAMRSRNHNPNA